MMNVLLASDFRSAGNRLPAMAESMIQAHAVSGVTKLPFLNDVSSITISIRLPFQEFQRFCSTENTAKISSIEPLN